MFHGHVDLESEHCFGMSKLGECNFDSKIHRIFQDVNFAN
jgi:hypothetical protein